MEQNLPAIQGSMKVFASEADRYVALHRMELYRKTKSRQTVRRHLGDIALFEQFLSTVQGLPSANYQNELWHWGLITFGVLETFREWMLNQGYAMGSINGRLYTVRKYCLLAYQSGFMEDSQYGLIQTVKGYSGDERRNIDDQRNDKRKDSSKKANPVQVSYEQAERLKKQDDPRDGLIMCLFIDLGLRVGEVATLRVDNFNLSTGELKFYRHKVNKTQTHKLTKITLDAAKRYLEKTKSTTWAFPGNEKLHKDDLQGEILGTRAINRLVGKLGTNEELENLSPHDLRHYWATRATKRKTHVRDLQQAGGWKSPYMPLRYAEDNAIANEGVIL